MSEIGIILKSARASGMPMIVMNSAMPETRWPIASHHPARITQMTLPRNEPTPAVGFATIVRPKGQSTKLAVRNEAIAHGIVMIGMHSRTPAST